MNGLPTAVSHPMSGILVPIILTILGLITAVITYRDIRRGGARFYTLEREAMLRRASFTLIGSVLLMTGAVGLLILDRQQQLATEAAASGETVEGVATPTPTESVQIFPPTPTFTPTPDPSIPPPSPTPIVCRASIEATGGSGLTLRDAPGGNEVTILPEGSIVTVIDDEPINLNGIIWRHVRVLGGAEGWAAEDFLSIGAPCE